MISVVIPTWNAERTLAATLTALVPAVVEGIVREVIIADCQSTDGTRAIADAAGARLIDASRGRGCQLRAGGEAARHKWLLFLHADTVLQPGWFIEAAEFIEKVEMGQHRSSAAAFRFALNDTAFAARVIEWGVGLRCRAFALPYGDQGLLIARSLYEGVGRHKAVPLFEDVDIVRSLGRKRMTFLRATATTSAVRYRRRGFARQVLRNSWCVALYFAGASPERLEKIYNA